MSISWFHDILAKDVKQQIKKKYLYSLESQWACPGLVPAPVEGGDLLL